MLSSHKRHKPLIPQFNERPLWPLHFETKRKNNKWPTTTNGLHKITSDGKLTYSRKTNEWTFAWVYEMQKAPSRETQADGSIHAVSIDPGVRTPFTWYSPTKGTGKIGQNDIGRIIRICEHMDALISKRDQLTASSSKRKRHKAVRLGHAVARMCHRVYHLQSEVHRKAITFFTREFDAVIIPPFEVSDMVGHTQRRITCRTVCQMLCWAHHRFCQRLLAKAEELNVRVIIQNEAYTSKTCSACGNMQNIGGSKMYRCARCGSVMDRDENGAGGIFLRALLDGALVLL